MKDQGKPDSFTGIPSAQWTQICAGRFDELKDTIKELSTEVKGAVMKIERHEAHLNNGILSTINKIENRMWAFLAMSFFTVASSVAALVALLLR